MIIEVNKNKNSKQLLQSCIELLQESVNTLIIYKYNNL